MSDKKLDKAYKAAMEAARKARRPAYGRSDNVSIEEGEKIRTFGGWYQHDKVFLGDKQIGTIQIRRKNKRSDIHTSDMQGRAVMGSNIDWLVREATKG